VYRLVLCKIHHNSKTDCKSMHYACLNTNLILSPVFISVLLLYCLSTGWTTVRLRFDPRQRRKELSSSLCVQTGSGAHPAFCTMGTGGPFPGGKARPGRDADDSPHLVPRSGMSRSYASSPRSAFMACSGTDLAFFFNCGQ
jgi:hypothetical protein